MNKIKYESPFLLRTYIQKAFNRGIFDCAILGNINKAFIYQKLPKDIKNIIVQSSFYRYISCRRLVIYCNKDLFFNVCNNYFQSIQEAPHIDDTSFYVANKTILQFKELLDEFRKDP
jgi:hypothetical protein